MTSKQYLVVWEGCYSITATVVETERDPYTLLREDWLDLVFEVEGYSEEEQQFIKLKLGTITLVTDHPTKNYFSLVERPKMLY